MLKGLIQAEMKEQGLWKHMKGNDTVVKASMLPTAECSNTVIGGMLTSLL